MAEFIIGDVSLESQNIEVTELGMLTTGMENAVAPGSLIDVEVDDDITMEQNHSYRANKQTGGTPLLFSLPPDNEIAEGGLLEVWGVGLEGWKIIQRAGEQIKIAGDVNETTAGTSGSLFSVYPNDSVRLKKIASKTYLALTFGTDFE